MKLKYYLRGVGVGLVLAVVVYSMMIIPRKYKMTDEEILERAKELGMVSEENMDVDLSALSGTPAPPEETGTPVPTKEETPEEGEEEKEPSPSGVGSPTPTKGEEPSVTPSASPNQDTNSVPTTPAMPTMPSVPTMPSLPPTPLPQGPEISEGEKVSITIPQGMGSDTLALELQKAGLVEDATDFDRYLMQNNYALYIRPGTYHIFPNSTYEEIAKQVTAN